ncbi:hypothetical protein A2V82_05205 [candidate division KSB1 bacterium RBG_16_48_16]|nr:MAG: hypothetical protein A2V82_05205 [candidate division KSB1 bacterium RBG_16_48_16]
MGRIVNLAVEMSLRGRLILISIGIVFIVLIFQLMRRKQVSESLGLLWLILAVGMIVVISSNALLMRMTHLLGAQYPTSTLTLIGLVFIVSLLLFFTLKITFLINKTQSLSQHIALKEFEHETKVRELEKEIADLKQKPVRLNEKDEKQ